ncbi:MAG TPA: hypothetical protein VKN99_16615, partial [Polyangia bacterium]|nr:hypothetical protein [Polyangia bacterium]
MDTRGLLLTAGLCLIPASCDHPPRPALGSTSRSTRNDNCWRANNRAWVRATLLYLGEGTHLAVD